MKNEIDKLKIISTKEDLQKLVSRDIVLARFDNKVKGDDLFLYYSKTINKKMEFLEKKENKKTIWGWQMRIEDIEILDNGMIYLGYFNVKRECVEYNAPSLEYQSKLKLVIN